MAALEDFLPYVRVHVSGLPAPVMVHELRTATIQFCERSRAWKGMDALDVVAGESRYVVPVPDEAQLAVLEEVYLGSQYLTPKPLDELRARWINWLDATGNPLYYTQLEPDAITLVPKPVVSQVDGLRFRAHFKPLPNAKQVPDFLLNHYGPIIASGALAKLMMMPDLPCHNPKLAEHHQAQFDLGAARANTQADRSFTRAPRRVVGRFM